MRVHFDYDASEDECDTDFMNGRERLYLYGASKFVENNWTLTIINQLKDVLDWEINFVDRNENKQRDGFRGYPVIAPECLFREDKNKIAVVVCVSFARVSEVTAILQANGFVAGENMFSDLDFITRVLPRHLRLSKKSIVEMYAEY